MFERILFKLIVIHLLALVFVQGFLTQTPLFKNINKIYLYEGVGKDVEEDKLEVLNQK